MVWKYQGKGYLYTDFFRFEDVVFFGTAGCGGHFYILSLLNGKLLLDINTGGTSRIICSGAFCYIYLTGKKSALIKVDLRSHTIESLSLPKTATIDSQLAINGDKIYMILYDVKGSDLPGAVYLVVADEI